MGCASSPVNKKDPRGPDELHVVVEESATSWKMGSGAELLQQAWPYCREGEPICFQRFDQYLHLPERMATRAGRIDLHGRTSYLPGYRQLQYSGLAALASLQWSFRRPPSPSASQAAPTAKTKSAPSQNLRSHGALCLLLASNHQRSIQLQGAPLGLEGKPSGITYSFREELD